VYSGLSEVHVILNGTLNFIWCDLSIGNPPGHVIQEAKTLGYAEPEAVNHFDIIRGEALQDAPKKTSILNNIGLKSDTIISAKDIEIFELDDNTIRRMIKQSNNRRFIVSFVRRDSFFEPNDGDILVFDQEVGDWRISGGFREVDKYNLYRTLCDRTPWVNNSILTVSGDMGTDGINYCTGAGAGPDETTLAMIIDAENMMS